MCATYMLAEDHVHDDVEDPCHNDQDTNVVTPPTPPTHPPAANNRNHQDIYQHASRNKLEETAPSDKHGLSLV